MLKEGVYKQTMECSNQTERNYSGNINGKFWPVQSTRMIEKYGGEFKNTFVDEEEDGSEDEEDTSNFDSIITRDDFKECAMPWIRKHAKEMKQFIKSVKYSIDDTEVEADWKLGEVPEDKAEMVADYCMLKEIEYFFRKTDEDYCLINEC